MSFTEAQIIDPRTDPGLANAIAADLTGPKREVVRMTVQPSNVVELPGGYIDENDMVHTEARIREITGADEEALAREFRSPNFTIAKMVDTILKRTVVSVGNEEASPGLLGRLLVGDRSALLLAVRILTFGSDWEVEEFPCRLCGQTFGVVIELDKDIKTRTLENRQSHEITVELRNGREAVVSLLTGENQLEMFGDGNRTVPEEQTIAIDRCIRRIDGQPVLPPLARQMGMADRHKIIDAMIAGQPGPLMEEVSVQCSNCQGEANYAVSLVDLFR